MLVFVKENLVIIDVPKCATTSINSVLRQRSDIFIGGTPNLKHLKFRESLNMLEILFSGKLDIREFEFVSLFRSRVEWLYSWYCYRSRNELKNSLHPNHLNRMVERMSFESWLSDRLKKKLVFPTKTSSSTRGNSHLSDDTLGRFCSKYPKDFRLFETFAVELIVLNADFNSEENVGLFSSQVE
ncbi:MAG: hypothetical protein ACI9N9_001364 [Enterobacterales bacterium]|jgi:hypothetical protein